MLLNSIAGVCTGVGNRANGNSMFIFVASWPGKRNVYEIYKFKGLYVKHIAHGIVGKLQEEL